MKAQTTLADLIRRTKLIIWDEAPSQHRHCFEAVDRTFKDLRHCQQWFGGITMVFGGVHFFFESGSNILGDFRQCLPVVPRASRAQITAATISNSVFWKDVVQLKLHVNMRLLSQTALMTNEQLQYAKNFAKWLLNIGNGEGCQISPEVSLPERKLASDFVKSL